MIRYYAPYGASRELFSRRDSEVLLSGPAGTGKSRACLEKLNVMALLNPGMRGLMVRKTAVSLGSTGLVTWRQHVIPELLAHGELEWYGGSVQEPPAYRYRNGSTISVGGMDKATKIMSSEYDAIYVQEATELQLNDWEALTTRLRNGRMSFQQLIADCNPDAESHWLKQRSNSGKTRILWSKHEDNPVYFNRDGTPTAVGAAYMDKLDSLTGVRYLRLRKGIWAAAEGLVYEDWDPAVHLVDRFPIPDSWDRYWSIDFGYNHPFVCQCWAEDPDGRLFMYREFYGSGVIVEDWAKCIMREVTDERGLWKEPEPIEIICDHDAEGRATLERHILRGTRPAVKRVKEGIQAVQGRLRAAGDGRPRLFLLRDSLVERDQNLAAQGRPTSTAEEVTGYTWATGAGQVVKEEPVKIDDDGVDALRYVVAARDLKGRPDIRWI